MEWDDTAARRLSTRELRTFLAVAQSRSMAKAAKTLATSQPAISKTIADMERALGVRLLDRSPQGVEPTRYGHALVKCGIAVFNELKQGINEIGFLADPTAGELRIACPDPVAAGLVQAVIDRVLLAHPRLTFHIETALVDRQLRERNVELAVNRLSDAAVGEDLNIEILYHDSLAIVAGTNNPWIGKRKVRLADLVDEPWVLPKSDGPMWSHLIRAFHANGLKPPRVVVTTGSYHMRFSLLATGRFLSVRPSMALKFQAKQAPLKALPIDLPMTLGPIAILTLRNRTLSPVARLFIEHTRAVVKEITR